MKIKTNLIIALLLMLFISSCEEDTDNVSTVTNYPLITVVGNTEILLKKGTFFTDPGVIATENGATISTTVSSLGQYRGGNFDKNVPDDYVFTYTAKNKDGFSASATRHVIIAETGDLVNSIEGLYTCTVSRNGVTPSAAYKNMKYILVWKNTNGTYQFSDGIGAWYYLGRALGLGYLAPGLKVTANSIPTNSFTFGGSYAVGTFGGTVVPTGLTVNATAKTMQQTATWTSGTSVFNFIANLTQVQF